MIQSVFKALVAVVSTVSAQEPNPPVWDLDKIKVFEGNANAT